MDRMPHSNGYKNTSLSHIGRGLVKRGFKNVPSAPEIIQRWDLPPSQRSAKPAKDWAQDKTWQIDLTVKPQTTGNYLYLLIVFVDTLTKMG